ncbi:MAG: TonB-dependent receptor [Parvibaculum sp.]|uniref:TonB-dependent receptor n=1 Tax=Parvibaculum sp. TaxID=2024848 RepID=UPI0025EFE149|nr:TonB-dependent receptor [Parvibaculum sp.]MCE9649074.1 TonB-dependent receptor [Parvibaculum sp.]
MQIIRTMSAVMLASSAFALPAWGADQESSDAATLPPMMVTTSPLPVTLDELAAPVTVVTRDEILNSGAPTLGALLGNKPGIAQSSFAAGASRPIIRGLDNYRVKFLENGLGSDGVSSVSEDHGVPIDPLSATRVEVVRGPATLRYGSQAIGGVVNVINSRIPTEIPEGGFKSEAAASYDTVSDGRQGSALMEAALGNVVFHADAYDRKTEDYRIPGSPSRQDMTWTDSQGVAGGASVILDNGYVGASVSHFDADYGIPVPDPADPTFIDMEQTKAQVAAEFDDLGTWVKTLRLTGGYNKYNHGEVGSLSGDVGSVFDDRQWEGRAEILHGNVGPFTGVIGVHAIDHKLSAGGEGGELLAPTETQTLAVFVFEEMPITEALKLQFGGRVEHAVVDGGALDEVTLAVNREERSFAPLSGSGGLVWKLGGNWVAGATAQVSQRAPEAPELFSKGPHEATETFEIGDPTLGKETAISTELSLRREGKDYAFEAAVYRTKFNGYVLKSLTGETCDDTYDTCTNYPGGSGTELQQVRYSQQDATFRGLEISGRHSIFDLGAGVVGLDGQFDLVRAELDSGGNVPRIPPMRVGAGVYYEADDFTGRVGFLHAFEQNDVGTFETETAGYTLLNAELHYLLPQQMTGSTPVEVSLIGENFLNDDVRNHVSFKKNGMLLPGRNVRFAVAARF